LKQEIKDAGRREAFTIRERARAALDAADALAASLVSILTLLFKSFTIAPFIYTLF
jgi:hypothetical protein